MPEVARVDVVRGDKTFALEKQKPEDKKDDATAAETWHLTQPVNAPANERAADIIAGQLSRLRANRYVAESPSDLAQYGLAEPAIRVTVTMKAKEGETAKQHVLLVGSAVPAAAAMPGALSSPTA